MWPEQTVLLDSTETALLAVTSRGKSQVTQLYPHPAKHVCCISHSEPPLRVSVPFPRWDWHLRIHLRVGSHPTLLTVPTIWRGEDLFLLWISPLASSGQLTVLSIHAPGNNSSWLRLFSVIIFRRWNDLPHSIRMRIFHKILKSHLFRLHLNYYILYLTFFSHDAHLYSSTLKIVLNSTAGYLSSFLKTVLHHLQNRWSCASKYII